MTVKNFNDAQIRISAASNVVIENVFVQIPTNGFIRLGIQMEGGTGNVIKNSTAVCLGTGFMVGFTAYGTNHRVAGNHATGCSTGISVTDGPGLVVEENQVDSSTTGIAIGGGNIRASRNTISGTTSKGISFIGSYSNVTISHNLVTNSTGIGVYVSGGSGLNVSDNIVSNNSGGGIRAGGTAVTHTYTGNNVAGNSVYGICACTTASLDLRNNWWGDASGPSGIGPGTGDVLTGPSGTLFDPWLASPNGLAGP
ncbi:MAG: right-handed parallel beta-helix repeat-containing protein [Euryarchaeota archaeon]|nr:right-handed parallel beta-helix repeat-containing protein [Euryarchaeota archaeon]